MMRSLSLFLAFRYVSRRHSSGFSSFISASSTLGIALGVMVLIVVLSAMNGFEKALSEKLLSIIPHAEIESVHEPIEQWPLTAKTILKHPSVLSVAPVIKLNGMLQKKGQLKGVEVRGIDPLLETQVSAITDYVSHGKWQQLNTPNSLVIGSGIASKLNLKVGDNVQLLVPQANSNFKQKFPAPKISHLTVVAIFKFGGVVDDSLAYVSLNHAQQLLAYDKEQVNALRIKVQDVFEASRVIQKISYDVRQYVYVQDWTQTQGHIFQDIQLVRMVMFIVLALVIAVASFNIVSTLIMVVNEKKGDIAILKTMGARPSTIMLSFITQGLINGVLGCLIGTVSGVYLAQHLTDVVRFFERLLSAQFLSGDVYFINYIPSILQWNDVWITVAIALILSLTATIYPAWRATKIDPAKVLGQI